ncbi:MAG: hypothetical protein K2Y08_07870 [Alphaproteobacteria bacterium]|nr:hypothetical protein [Alphaproteobacteria bacterium]
MDPDKNMDLDNSKRTPPPVSAEVIKAVKENKQRVLRTLPDEEKLTISKYPEGVDVHGRHPGDKNYGASESDSLIEDLIRKGDDDITWCVIDFKDISSPKMEKYMRAINYTELW